ncbi:MAG: MBL fold metallo-hydrolase [Thermoplasmata archaeon]|nr:MBL fold metallo-hydrolase [Thermoplasmata archaeon]
MPDPTVHPHPYPRPVREEGVALLSPVELAGQLGSGEPPLLLDVRGKEERSSAHLPRDVHIPLAELPRRIGELPRGRAIVTYCHFGSEARRAALFLETAGFPGTSALEGGIDEYSRQVDPTILRYKSGSDPSGLILQQLPRPESGCLAYLLADPETGMAVVIDPGREVDGYIAQQKAAHWTLRGIIETHTHADHLAGHSRLHALTDAPIYVGRRSPAQYPHQTVAEGDSVDFGRATVRVLETPGHTADHVSLRVGDKVFTGDTLLIGACGRTDLGDGDPSTLWESLTEKILRLPDETEVFPAHFGRRHALPERYVSSVGFERATNEALNQGSKEAFLRYMTEGWPPKPNDFDRIVHENLVE